jgi:DNA-binding NtrC family response regulator
MSDKPIRLLIVDDEVKFLDSIARRLEMRGFDVTKAASGQEAVDITQTERFDLALLDLKMPGLNGREVLEILKREHRFLEVIILTGHGSVESAVDCTKLGAFSYLPKPYEFEKLLEVLRAAYEARIRRKLDSDQERVEKILRFAVDSSPLGILRALRELDDGEK